MSILKNLIGIKEIKEPIFYKEFKENIEAEERLLSLIEETEDRNKIRDIKSEIYAMRKGARGEKQVAYELKNSYIPMICLHDIRLEFEDKVAQFDFILLTHYFIMVLETKSLSCDVNINNYGEFERVIRLKNGHYYKKGMYSPVTQNDRHVRILRDFFIKNNLFKRLPIYSAVIIANEEAIINRKYAKKEVKDKIYKLDQITNLLEKTIKEEKKNGQAFEHKLINTANTLIENNKPIEINYRRKFGLDEKQINKREIKNEKISEEQYNREAEEIINKLKNKTEEYKIKEVKKGIEEVAASKEMPIEELKDKELREKLIAYRKERFIEEKIKPYFVFKNEAMENIIKAKPKNLQELKTIQGVGEKTVTKYGDDIIKIVKNII